MGPNLLAVLLMALSLSADGAHDGVPFGLPLERLHFTRIARRAGVDVYQDTSSPFIRLAAESRLNASPELVQEALLDYRAQLGTVKRVSQMKILQQGEGEMLVYQRLNLPVISDRDYVIRVTWGKSGGLGWIKYDAVESLGPGPTPGVVRVTHHQGSWQLMPVEGGAATELRYIVSIDLAGWLPRWLAKSNASREVPDVIADLCSMLRKRQGEEAKPCPQPSR